MTPPSSTAWAGRGGAGEAGPRDGDGEGHAPDAAGVGPVPGHARGQQQRRHGLVEEEVVIDELLLLRVRHALERVVLAGQVAVQARQRCGEAGSGAGGGPDPPRPPPRGTQAAVGARLGSDPWETGPRAQIRAGRLG